MWTNSDRLRTEPSPVLTGPESGTEGGPGGGTKDCGGVKARQRLLTVASYNIRKAVGADMRRRPERILDVLDETGADVAVLQEADRRFGARAAALPERELECRGWRHVPLGMTADAIGWHGNAVLVRSGIEVVAQRQLQLPVLEPRGAVMADLRIDGRPLTVVGMHLDLSGLWRRRQARTILRQLAARESESPTLLMGDMNEWRGAAGALADFAARHRPVMTGPSFPARVPLARLDRIFASGRLEIEASGVHQSALSRVASDHLPLWVRLRLP